MTMIPSYHPRGLCKVSVRFVYDSCNKVYRNLTGTLHKHYTNPGENGRQTKLRQYLDQTIIGDKIKGIGVNVSQECD